jgi:hypothetical protein
MDSASQDLSQSGTLADIRHTDALRHERVLPVLGDLVTAHGYHDGRPVRAEPGRVWDQRGGVPRRRGKKPAPPAIVEYKVDGYSGWYKWFQVVPVSGSRS